MKQRLDVAMAQRGLVSSRSQAESYVRLGQVKVSGRPATKAGQMVSDADEITLAAGEQYVGRAALKLKSAAEVFKLDFKDKTVLDVGSSTGGCMALQRYLPLTLEPISCIPACVAMRALSCMKKPIFATLPPGSTLIWWLAMCLLYHSARFCRMSPLL
jgi:ribosomal 50S subunit-recycling heat shock protein